MDEDTRPTTDRALTRYRPRVADTDYMSPPQVGMVKDPDGMWAWWPDVAAALSAPTDDRLDKIRALAEQMKATPADPPREGLSGRAKRRTLRRGHARAATLSIADQLLAILDAAPAAPTDTTEDQA